MMAVEVRRGASPVILALPHTGIDVPPDIFRRLTDLGQLLSDTDWHIHRLYDGLVANATSVRTTTHRYVIDVNRDPAGISLYPGQNTTALVPSTDFDGAPIWKDGAAPDASEISRRVQEYHVPYHAALVAEIERVKAMHGIVVLYDCHSIRSRIPFLFEGLLPDFNIGTNDGRSCDRRIEAAVAAICATAPNFTAVLNGRFKGGWTTRHHGRPDHGVHAIQMELAQSTYLGAEAPPFAYEVQKAERMRDVLSTLLHRLEELAPHLGESSS